jgi:hypothetical protein
MPSYNCWTKHGERGDNEEEEDDDMYPKYGDTVMTPKCRRSIVVPFKYKRLSNPRGADGIG